MGKGSASVGQIWESSKAYMGSNTLKRYDGVIHQETVKNLGSFLQTKGLFDVGIDNETRADDRLQKYNIMQFSPTKHLDEMHNMAEVYLITDDQGHDIGTYTVDENGHGVFKLSPKIEEMNRKIIEKMETEKEREFLRDKYDINSMEDLAEKLAKGEEVALSSKEQGKAEFKEHELAQFGEDFETEDSQNPEDAKEQEEIKALPADMRAEVLQMCHDKNIKVTEIMIVQDCRDVYEQMGGDGPKTVSPTGGPVIMVRAAGVTDDKLFMFQKGQLLPNTDPQKDRMLEIMYQHKGSQNLADFEDHREDGILDQMLEAVAEYEQEMASYENAQFESEEEKLQCIDAAKARLGKSIDGATEDYTPDSDGDVACLSRAIEEEVDQDSRDEAIERKMEEHEGGEHEDEEHDADDTELSRWDKADPYQSNKRF